MSDEVALLRQQLQQLAQLHADGALDDAAYHESRAKLERRLVDAVMSRGPEAGASRLVPHKPLRVWAGLTAVALIAGALGYLGFQSTLPSAPASVGAAASAETATSPTGAGTLSGQVSLAPELASRAAPDDTVFIFARAAGTAGVPLAVLRKRVQDLPVDFTLDDSLAMVPDSRLSNVSQAVVVARISKSGDAIPQPGDLSGQVGPVALGASGLRIVVDTVVKH